jgi:hypothetical protein
VGVNDLPFSIRAILDAMSRPEARQDGVTRAVIMVPHMLFTYHRRGTRTLFMGETFLHARVPKGTDLDIYGEAQAHDETLYRQRD